MGAPAAKIALVGRDRELTLVDESLAAARRGEGSSLMFVGEPGSGKTALLAEARRRAADFTVIWCTGVEWEAELPFGGLHELLNPLLEQFGALPDPQRNALEVALGRIEGEGGQSLHLFAGVLSVLTETTRSGPVLLLADDLQWIDSASREALGFVVRRLTGEAMVFLIGSRPGGDLPGLPQDPVQLAPLSAAAVSALAENVLGRPLLGEAAGELAQSSGGNPLAVIESLRQFGEGVWDRGTLLDAPMPVGALIERGFLDRIDGLSEQARIVVELMSATIDPSTATLIRALDALAIPRSALAEAEEAGIIEVRDSEIRFSHPVLRSLAYRRAAPEAIRRCHGALAGVLEDAPELHAWHIACATLEPNSAVADELDDAAKHFARRGGSIAASQALSRAASLTPSPDDRAGRLLRAGQYAYRAGLNDRSKQLFIEAAACARSLPLALEVEIADAYRGAHTEHARDIVMALEGVIGRARGAYPEVMFKALSAMTNEVILSGRADRLDITKTLLRDEVRDGRLDGELMWEIESTAGHLAVLTGRTAEEYRDGAQRVRASAKCDFGYGSVVIPMLVEALTWIEDHDDAQLIGSRQLGGARRAGDALVLTTALWSEGLRNLYTGNWKDASGQFSEVIQICKAIGSDGNALTAESTFAVLQAMQGDTSWETEVDRIAEAGPRFGTHLVEEHLGTALGSRALAAGDGAAAIQGFGRAVAWQRRSQQFEPFTPWWPADLVEAHLLDGDEAAAREGTEALRARAEMTGQRRIAAMVARLDGLLAGDAASPHFERAIVLGEEARDPYGVARTQLAYGRHLRRARKRAEARSMLRSALETFERLGAAPWVDQSRRELEATGLVLRRGEAADPQALTPQEAQVAELVSGGASNKEVAGVLFVSPKTIETHLSRIYRKLGVTSRTQLALRLREQRELLV